MPDKSGEIMLLYWSEKTGNPSVQDPLGMNLRVGARLGSQLLYCITSITPRARYYSFLAWCVVDYLDRVKGTALDRGLRTALLLRERALTLGCVFDHGGEPCEGGGIIGSREAANVVIANNGAVLRLDTMELSRNLAWDAYKGSLAGLDLFAGEAASEVTGFVEGEQVDSGESGEEITEDDLTLSEAGKKLARLFGEGVSHAAIFKAVTQPCPQVTPVELAEWGRSAGMCALAAGAAPELHELRAMFLRTGGSRNSSHRFRHDSLTVLLSLVSQMASRKSILNESVFATATYFRQVYDSEGTVVDVEWPNVLDDIVKRWRLFHSHYYLSVALEGLFVNVVRKGLDVGLDGFTLDELIAPLEGQHITGRLSKTLSCNLPRSFLDLSLKEVALSLGLACDDSNSGLVGVLNDSVRLDHVLSEPRIEELLRNSSVLHTPEGIALSLLLAMVVTVRFAGWHGELQSEWLWNNVYDAAEDITAPLVYRDLTAHYDDWLNVPFRELGKRVIQRFVVRQHETLAYAKSRSGGKILFHTERGRIIGRGIPYDSIGVSNPRFRSAIQIMIDLGWVKREDGGILELTGDGLECLEHELATMEVVS